MNGPEEHEPLKDAPLEELEEELGGHGEGTAGSEGEPDFYRQGFEVVKQLTTLSAGSIVLIGTFIKDIFPRDAHTGALAVDSISKGLIISSFILFGLSLVASSVSMYVCTQEVEGSYL